MEMVTTRVASVLVPKGRGRIPVLGFCPHVPRIGTMMAQTLVVFIVELLFHDLSENVPFTQAKSLIKHIMLFLPF